jgi:murein L,D-transpeptidase YafK
LSCATLVRVILLWAAFLGSLPPYRGFAEDGDQLPTKATKELPPQLLSLLLQRNMPKRSPILVRIFKEESELEVWKQGTTGRFELLKVHPICRWSGDLGPKITEGDRQATEGFYTITPGLMNPNSNYYLAINTGFPNAYDRANDRHGGFLMIHGDCSSIRDQLLADRSLTFEDIANTEGAVPSYATRLFRLTVLAPDIVGAILSGKHPPELTARRLMDDTRLPLDWNEQRRCLGFASAT